MIQMLLRSEAAEDGAEPARHGAVAAAHAPGHGEAGRQTGGLDFNWISTGFHPSFSRISPYFIPFFLISWHFRSDFHPIPDLFHGLIEGL